MIYKEPWTCYFSVIYHDESNDINEVDNGIVVADSYGQAAEKLELYYGTDLVSIEKLKWVGDGEILILKEHKTVWEGEPL